MGGEGDDGYDEGQDSKQHGDNVEGGAIFGPRLGRGNAEEVDKAGGDVA